MPLQLVRHAAGAEDDDAQILRERLDGAPERLAEVAAAVARRRRELHDIHGQRNDPAGPFLRLAEHQGERHGQAMIDVHLVDDREIELVEDDRLRDMTGQHGMPDDGRHRPRTPAFVRRRKLRRTTQRECRNDVRSRNAEA